MNFFHAPVAQYRISRDQLNRCDWCLHKRFLRFWWKELGVSDDKEDLISMILSSKYSDQDHAMFFDLNGNRVKENS